MNKILCWDLNYSNQPNMAIVSLRDLWRLLKSCVYQVCLVTMTGYLPRSIFPVVMGPDCILVINMLKYDNRLTSLALDWRTSQNLILLVDGKHYSREIEKRTFTDASPSDLENGSIQIRITWKLKVKLGAHWMKRTLTKSQPTSYQQLTFILANGAGGHACYKILSMCIQNKTITKQWNQNLART